MGQQADVAIVGYGALGAKVAELELARGRRVVALSRSTGPMPKGAQFSAMDLDGVAPWPAPLTQCRWIYYFAPPPSAGTEDPRIENFLQGYRSRFAARRILLLSTTAVYGDCGDAWVNELTPVRPETDRGRRRLEAEQALRQWSAGHHELDGLILRVAGIYGPDRLPLDRLRQGMSVLDEAVAGFSNRIHEDDLAAICVAAMDRGRAGEVYNVSDGQPSSMSDYFLRLSKLFELEPPEQLDWQQAEARFSSAMLSYLRESKRIDNRKLLSELEIELSYPDLDLGLAACKSVLGQSQRKS